VGSIASRSAEEAIISMSALAGAHSRRPGPNLRSAPAASSRPTLARHTFSPQEILDGYPDGVADGAA